MIRWQVSEACDSQLSLQLQGGGAGERGGCDDRQDLPLSLVTNQDARLRIGKMTGWAQIRLRLLSHRNDDSLGLGSITLP